MILKADEMLYCLIHAFCLIRTVTGREVSFLAGGVMFGVVIDVMMGMNRAFRETVDASSRCTNTARTNTFQAINEERGTRIHTH